MPVIIAVLVLIIMIIGIIILIQKKKNNRYIPTSGGAFTLYFETNGKEKIESMHICIAGSPDSYKDIPIPKDDSFEGWYYDEDFKNKVEVISSKDIKPIPEKDAKGYCIGFKDITLYAKWNNSK